MPIFHKKLEASEIPESSSRVAIQTSRILLQKKRWRTTADNGEEVAVDLEHTVSHGDCVGVDSNKDVAYIIHQEAEEVIIIEIPENKDDAATIGWMLGNQHLPIEVHHGSIRLAYDKGVTMLLERNSVPFQTDKKRFMPSPHSHTHGHSHNHSHA